MPKPVKFAIAGLVLVVLGGVLLWTAHAADTIASHANKTDLRWLGGGMCVVVGLVVVCVALMVARHKPE